jgi:hypothetical protein
MDFEKLFSVVMMKKTLRLPIRWLTPDDESWWTFRRGCRKSVLLLLLLPPPPPLLLLDHRFDLKARVRKGSFTERRRAVAQNFLLQQIWEASDLWAKQRNFKVSSFQLRNRIDGICASTVLAKLPEDHKLLFTSKWQSHNVLQQILFGGLSVLLPLLLKIGIDRNGWWQRQSSPRPEVSSPRLLERSQDEYQVT